MSDQLKFKLYEWAEWITKAVLAAICGLLWQMNLDISRSLQILQNHGTQITELKGEVAAIKQGYMTRIEVLETIKRVEMNQEKLLLQYELKSMQDKVKK
jgi:hypothetical protein